MPESLKVIALLSGGKDSFFSILHCLANGHEIVALANLYPQPNVKSAEHPPDHIPETLRHASKGSEEVQGSEIDDVESYMYQTIGHAVIPLYASALNIPVYRQPICGQAVTTSKTYHPLNTFSTTTPTSVSGLQSTTPVRGESSVQDETESLIPLLQHIKSCHPEANAVSTGAIFSTYQRTRIESVASRLSLVSLAYLWQYPLLPPYTQSSLLHDMSAIGIDARIVKVASGGLDSSMLWENVTDPGVIRRLSRATQRFVGSDGEQFGAVLGEGGEFETLALDGPEVLFARRISVEDDSKSIVSGEGGTAFVRIREARVVEKDRAGPDKLYGAAGLEQLRRPCLWDDEFTHLLRTLEEDDPSGRDSDALYLGSGSERLGNSQISPGTNLTASSEAIPLAFTAMAYTIYVSNATAVSSTILNCEIGVQAASIISTLKSSLSVKGLSLADITFTAIFLRSMASFAKVNTAYSTLFHLPNPPARITIAVGDSLPPGLDVMMSFTIQRQPNVSRIRRFGEKGACRLIEALHVQSQSYWAPANIGPYSQAVAVPIELQKRHTSVDDFEEEEEEEEQPRVVHVAGQIPLVPADMALLESSNFREHAALSLQHLWRVGRAMRVTWWGGGAVAFVTALNDAEARHRAILAGNIWNGIHNQPENKGEEPAEGESEVDVGDAALYRPWAANSGFIGARSEDEADKTYRSPLPNWSNINDEKSRTAFHNTRSAPPFIAVEVSELPRGAQVEWWSFGFSDKSHIFKTHSDDEQVETCTAESMSVSWRWCKTAEILRILLEATEAENQFQSGADTDASIFLEIFSPYPLEEKIVSKLGAMIIPCKSVWDSSGTRLFAAVRTRRQRQDTKIQR